MAQGWPRRDGQPPWRRRDSNLRLGRHQLFLPFLAFLHSPSFSNWIKEAGIASSMGRQKTISSTRIVRFVVIVFAFGGL